MDWLLDVVVAHTTPLGATILVLLLLFGRPALRYWCDEATNKLFYRKH